MNVVQSNSYNYNMQNLYRKATKSLAKTRTDFIKENVYLSRKSTELNVPARDVNLLRLDQKNEKENQNMSEFIELSEDDIQYFREKYDVENMTHEEYLDLLKELSNRNVISDNDMENQFAHLIPPGGSMIMAWDGFSEPEPDERNILEKLQWEMKTFEYSFAMIKNGKYSVKETALYQDKLLKYYEERISANEKIAKILKQIKRNSCEDLQHIK